MTDFTAPFLGHVHSFLMNEAGISASLAHIFEDLARRSWSKARKRLCSDAADIERARAKNLTEMAAHCTAMVAALSGGEDTIHLLNACPEGVSAVAFLESIQSGKVTFLRQPCTHDAEPEGLPCA